MFGSGMAIEPQPAPQQLVFPTFRIIGRPPALLARMSDDSDQTRLRTSSPEPMPLDTALAHSPTGETSGSHDFLSRMSNPGSLPAGPSTVSNAPSAFSPPALATSPHPTTPVSISARLASASTPDVPTFSPIVPSFEKGKGLAMSGGSSSMPVEQSSSTAQSTSLTSPHVTDTPHTDLGYDFPGFLQFLEKRTQSLNGVHNSNATRAKNWTDQARKTATSGVELLEFLRTLIADADAAAAQASRAREEADRAAQLATNLQSRVKEALSLVESLQQEHTHNRDLAEKVQQYSERLKTWDAATGEKEKSFIAKLRNHLQAEENARTFRSAEAARLEAARADEDAARARLELQRAQDEATRSAERNELNAVRAELEAAKRKELALIKERDDLQRANNVFLASVEGLRAFTSNLGANSEARIAPDSSILTSTAARSTTPVTPAVHTATTSSSRTAILPQPKASPSGLISSPALAADASLQLNTSSPVARQTTSPAQVTSRPLVMGFVPAQTEAGRALNTQSPLASTARTSSRSVRPTPEAQRSSPTVIPVRGSSIASAATSTAASPDVMVKQEPEPDTELPQSTKPSVAQSDHSPAHAAETLATPPPSAAAVVTPSIIESAPTPTQRPPSPISNAEPTSVALPAPPLVREPEPLREPSPMGPGYDGDHHSMMPPERDYDLDDRRSFDSHPEDRLSPANRRSIDLRLPPKPQVTLPPLRDERPDQPPSPIHQRSLANQSPIERHDPGRPVVNRRKFGERGGSSGGLRNMDDDALPSSSSGPSNRPFGDEEQRQSWEDRRRNGSGPSRPAPIRTADSYVPGHDDPYSPGYERNGWATSPRQDQGGFEQRTNFPPQSPSVPGGHFNYSASSPNTRNARPRGDPYLGRASDHYSPERSTRDPSPQRAIQRRPSRGGDMYRPSPPQAMPQRQQVRDYQDQSRRNPPPRQTSPDSRPAPRNDGRSQPSGLQARISSGHGGGHHGSSTNTSPPAGDLMSRIGVPSPKRTYSHNDDDDDDEREPKRARGPRGVNRLLRSLRSKCAALTSATRTSTDEYTKSRITDYARATGKGGEWAIEDPPPLAVFDDPKKLEGRALDRRSMMNMPSCKLVHDVVGAWKNILQAALPTPQASSTGSSLLPLTSMCAAIVGRSMVGVVGTGEAEFSESEGDYSGDEESDAEGAEMAAIQELYDAVPTRFRNWTLISHSLTLLLSSCPHNPTLFSCLLDLSLNYRLVQESRSILSAYLSLCVQPAASNMAPPLAHPSHTEFLKDLSSRWTSTPASSSLSALPHAPQQGFQPNPHFSTRTFVDIFVTALSETQCHEAWTCKATARLARRLRQTDTHGYASLCGGLMELLCRAPPAADDDRPERLALWLDNLPMSFQAEEDVTMSIMHLICAAQKAGLHVMDTTRLAIDSPMRLLQSALVCIAIRCLGSVVSQANSHLRYPLITLLRSAPQTATLDSVVGPCFDVSTSSSADTPSSTQALSDSFNDIFHRVDFIASALREGVLARLESSLWSCALRHFQRMKLSEGSGAHASNIFRQKLVDARTAAAGRRVLEDAEIERMRSLCPSPPPSRPSSPVPEPMQIPEISRRSLGAVRSVPVHRPMRFQSASTTVSPVTTPRKPRATARRRASRGPAALPHQEKSSSISETSNASSFLLASLKTVSLKLLEHRSSGNCDERDEALDAITPRARRSDRPKVTLPTTDADSESDWSRDEGLRGTKRPRSMLTPRARPRASTDSKDVEDIASPLAKRKRGTAAARAQVSRIALHHTMGSESESEESGSDWGQEHGADMARRAAWSRAQCRESDTSDSGSDWARDRRVLPRSATTMTSGSAPLQPSVRTRATSRRRASESVARSSRVSDVSSGPSLSPVRFKSLIAQASRRRVSLREEPPKVPRILRRRRIVLDSEDESGLDEPRRTSESESDIDIAVNVPAKAHDMEAPGDDDALDLFMYE
ncbi:unnamed protein product [Peniophora sp. CBMAI 1063]|nr:unnamed protein product [Peniophora sp. CBMAI 1063]